MLVAGQRAGGVAEVGVERAALHVADAHVAGGQLAAQVGAIAGIGGQLVEVLDALLHDQLSGRRRSAQVADGALDVEEERIGQRPQVVEALLGPGPFDAGHPRLPGGADHAGDQRQEHRRRGSDRAAMAAHELRGPVAERVVPGQHRQAGAVPPHVLGELIHRGVAPHRLLAERLQHDGVEIPLEAAPQPLRVGRTGAGARSRKGGGIGRHLGVEDGQARPQRLGLAHHPGDVGDGPAGDAVRPAAGEQLVEQHAQRVDVGGGGHRLAAHLFGAGVLGRHQLQPGRRRRQRLPGHLGIEQLGDAEIEQLGDAVLGDQHVGRLDVAVDHQVLVRVLHRRGQLQEDVEPRVGVEHARFGVLDQRRAVDELHHQVRPAVGRRAAVEQPGDVGMVEAGEDLPLGAEAADDGIGVHPALQHLEGDALVERVVVADGEIDRAHAALAQLADQAVGTDARFERRVERVVGLRSGRVVRHGHDRRV